MQSSYTFQDVHAQVKDKPHRPFLGFLVVAIAIILFISFQRKEIKQIANNIANSQKLLAIDISAKDRPVKLAAIGAKPLNGISTTQLSSKEIKERFDVIAYTENHIINKDKSSEFETYKKENSAADLLYVVSIDVLAGPEGLGKAETFSKSCSQDQKNFKAETNFTTTTDQGSFCELHNSIATLSAAFDHDLDPNTPAINATEEWFLHKKNPDGSRGDRVTYKTADTKDVMYVINPSNFQARQYVISRIKNKVTSTNPALGANGVFVKDIHLSLSGVRELTKSAQNTDIFEFALFNPAAADAAYADSIFYAISDLRNALNTYSLPLSLWGSMSYGLNNGFEWDKYSGVLNGAMMQDFTMRGGKVYNAQILENQLLQMQKWQDNGGEIIAQVTGKSAQRAVDARYGLAAYLLFTNGETSMFQYSEDTLSPGAFIEFPEYYYALGKPLGLRQPVLLGKNPNTKLTQYERLFECGKVEVQIDESQNDNVIPSSTITYNNGCKPGVSPTPSFTPSPTVTPTLIPTNTPLPTFTPFPTFTPVPTLTKAPLVCGWCGNDCVPFDPNRVCIMSVPPSGFDCKAVNAVCQKVKK